VHFSTLAADSLNTPFFLDLRARAKPLILSATKETKKQNKGLGD